MDVDQRAQPLFGHVLERRVAHGARVVDEDVDATPGVERGVDDRLPTFRRGDTVGVGDGFAAVVLDLLRGVVGGIAARSVAGDRAAEVVHDDARAALGEQERVLPAQPPACAGDDGDLTVEPQLAHHIGQSVQARADIRIATARGSRRGLRGGYRVEHQRDVAPPAIGRRIHRPEHAVEHRDDPRQILGDQVGTDEAGLLSAAGEVFERRVQLR